MTDIDKLEEDFRKADIELKRIKAAHDAAKIRESNLRTEVIEAVQNQRAALLAWDEIRINGYVEIDRRGSRLPRIVTIRGKTAYARQPGEHGRLWTYAYNPSEPNGPWRGVVRAAVKDSYAGPGKLYLEDTK